MLGCNGLCSVVGVFPTLIIPGRVVYRHYKLRMFVVRYLNVDVLNMNITGHVVNVREFLEGIKTKQVVLLLVLTEFRQPLQVKSHLEMPGILVQLGHIQRT